MLSQNHRFHGHGSLRFVLKNGMTTRSKFLTIRYSKNNKRVHSRFSVVVSKKISKRAVVRNRIRRRVYEILRLQLPRIQSAYDVVVIVNELSVQDLSSLELNKMLIGLLEKESLLQ